MSCLQPSWRPDAIGSHSQGNPLQWAIYHTWGVAMCSIELHEFPMVWMWDCCRKTPASGTRALRWGPWVRSLRDVTMSKEVWLPWSHWVFSCELLWIIWIIWIDMDCNTLKYVQPTMLIDVGTEVSSQSPSLWCPIWALRPPESSTVKPHFRWYWCNRMQHDAANMDLAKPAGRQHLASGRPRPRRPRPWRMVGLRWWLVWSSAYLGLSRPRSNWDLPEAEIVEDLGGRSHCRSLQRIAVLQARPPRPVHC